MLEPGVSLELANYRKKHISQVSYELFFRVPGDPEEAMEGRAVIRFQQARAQHGVILDFQSTEESVHKVMVNGLEAEYQFMNGHIVVPSDYIKPYQNQVEIAFTPTNQALNRSPEFMYSLLVPDRASTAFPCFDQPDLKATFHLRLDIPGEWTALSNGRRESLTREADRQVLNFAPDKPISTYLFAFAAGRFDTVTDSRGSRSITIFHRETDQSKLDHNLPRIFQHHFDALDWLENYSGIPYPFAKFDMLLLPGFQYSGMEHPGAIWYRDNRLLLDEQAPISQQLAKASLIAHETAHMWFGNLVTMEWFNDVWLKEVFAGYMADKIVHPQYPDVNHDLQFLLTHYPRASAVDRSKGTHPIKQELENMKEAGTLYGAIIYNKAPIVFYELEQLMGEGPFQSAVREYLQEYAYENADWDDLAVIFDSHTEVDVMAWSEKRIYGTGMPPIPTIDMNEAYLRGAFHLELYEEFLKGAHPAEVYFQSLLTALENETNAQLARYLAGNIQPLYWRFLTAEMRHQYGPALESLIWDKLQEAGPAEKPVFFDTYLSTAQSATGISNMVALFEGDLEVVGLDLTEERLFGIVATLMLHGHPEAGQMIDTLYANTENPDRKRRIEFLKPALSSDASERDEFFERLKEARNRRPEPWVTEGLQYLHHPLREGAGRKYLPESLAMLEEIQRTGDIFFPLNWLEASLSGYGDMETVKIVEGFLAAHPNLSQSLRLKVLQATDILYRAANQTEEARDNS